jgi:hypothetical protein
MIHGKLTPVHSVPVLKDRMDISDGSDALERVSKHSKKDKAPFQIAIGRKGGYH